MKPPTRGYTFEESSYYISRGIDPANFFPGDEPEEEQEEKITERLELMKVENNRLSGMSSNEGGQSRAMSTLSSSNNTLMQI